MYRHLERVLESVKEDVAVEQVDVDFSLGRKPPRIYAAFNRPEELSELVEDLSLGTSERHRELCEGLGQRANLVARIMKKHGLRSYSLSNPHFKGEDTYTIIYGYKHDQYRTPQKMRV